MKIKQTYLSKMTGIDKNKLSRLLTYAQEISGTDMERIARGLGKNVEYFLSDPFCGPSPARLAEGRIALYAGASSEKQEGTAKLLLSLMENIDEVLGAKSRFMGIAQGVEDGY